MMKFKFPKVLFIFLLFSAPHSQAIQLDWKGQFWADNHWINNYQLSGRPGFDNDTELLNAGGMYVPGTGEKNAVWYSVFLKLKPKVIVTDSIHLNSEFHVGSPIYGFMGRGYPTNGDERYNFTGSNKDSLPITAQRFWADIVTDFGTIEVGRAPLNWGLGAIWNSGDDMFDRYQSTGDMVRLTTKFGNFSVSPSLVKVSMGNNVAGAGLPGAGLGSTFQGNDDVTDINLGARYDNTEEDFELGFQWTHRAGNSSQKSIFFNGASSGSTRINYDLFDFFAKKHWARFSVGGEIPFYSGDIGAARGVNGPEFDYKAFAIILEAAYNSDLWDVFLKAGHVPGQPPTSNSDSRFRAIYLHKNYDLGLIMFNYNIFGLANNNPDTAPAGSQNSPYDAAIVNAKYLSLTPHFKLDKWTFKAGGVVAFADQTATAGQNFWNYQQRRFYSSIDNQSNFMGFETDLGVSFRWDEKFLLSWDGGLFFPGSYYEFSNHPGISKFQNSMMFASQVKLGIEF